MHGKEVHWEQTGGGVDWGGHGHIYTLIVVIVIVIIVMVVILFIVVDTVIVTVVSSSSSSSQNNANAVVIGRWRLAIAVLSIAWEYGTG